MLPELTGKKQNSGSDAPKEGLPERVRFPYQRKKKSLQMILHFFQSRGGESGFCGEWRRTQVVLAVFPKNFLIIRCFALQPVSVFFHILSPFLKRIRNSPIKTYFEDMAFFNGASLFVMTKKDVTPIHLG
jgi:hypothetical protein